MQDAITTTANGVRQLQRTTTETSNENINWEIPVLLRYNVNNYIGVGVGLQANVNAAAKQNTTKQIDNYEGITDKFLISTRQENSSGSQSFTGIKSGLILDLTLGAARIGPSLGARYVMNFKENFNYFQFYGIWKF